MKTVFECIDGHTCGNPVRVVTSNKPLLKGKDMSEKRLHFIREYDWIRKGLMFEPRGHDIMSGSLIYPPTNPENDAAILFIETSGCLPMCGHGTIGTVTIAIEESLIQPKVPGKLTLEVPAGVIRATYEEENGKVKSVTIRNVPSFVAKTNLKANSPLMGELSVDIAYGGNFYAIVDKQENFQGLEDFTADQLIAEGRAIRDDINRHNSFIHPHDTTIKGCSHVLWTGRSPHQKATAKGAVIYGDKAIDRSPCGTGTSARMAQWHAKGLLRTGDSFIHESIIGSLFKAKILGETKVGPHQAIIPSIEGWAKVTGYNRIIIDDEDDPFAYGFQVL